jgi:hypothetical protein
MNPNPETLLKDLPSLMNYLNPAIVFLWRLGLGRLINLWPGLTGRTMILTHNDRKNNRSIHTPLNYLEIDSVIYCWSFPGNQSEWNTDLIANPQVEIWLPDGWFSGVCEVVDKPDQTQELLKTVKLSSRFIEIISNAEKANPEDLLREYPMGRITRQSPRTGMNGPGGLAWLWPLIVVLLLGVRPKRRDR